MLYIESGLKANKSNATATAAKLEQVKHVISSVVDKPILIFSNLRVIRLLYLVVLVLSDRVVLGWYCTLVQFSSGIVQWYYTWSGIAH